MQSSVTLSWSSTDRHTRLTWAAACLAVVAAAMAVWGLPPLDIHGPLHRLGVMDPLCGGTRAAYFAMTGRWAVAWYYNPLGPLTLIAVVLVLLRAALGRLTGRWVELTIVLTRRAGRALVAAASLLVVAMTVRQQLMVGILR